MRKRLLVCRWTEENNGDFKIDVYGKALTANFKSHFETSKAYSFDS